MVKYLLSVKQINNNMTNCFIPICTENAFSTVLEYMNIPYKYAFAYATNFSFCKDKLSQFVDDIAAMHENAYNHLIDCLGEQSTNNSSSNRLLVRCNL